MEFWETIWKSILLGTVQGLTEFLPVSSSGHLVLLQRLLGYSLEGGSMTFINIMLHFGTLIAVTLYFRKDIAALFKSPIKPLIMLLVATVPAGLAGVFLADAIDSLFTGTYGAIYLALCFGVTALLLFSGELTALRKKAVPSPLGWRQAVSMGLIQAVAILPGISRSGSTIAAGTLAGGRAEEVSRFSFLMSIPIILGSVAMGLKGAIDEPGMLTAMGAAGIWGIVFGIVAAALSGYFAIKLMMRLVKKVNYKWFVLYLLLLALFSLWLNTMGIV
ncbi:MAG: undecaprenyl-diphosphate phosphatase [Clostridia bacterium]|nr:undecaprenyl-diphosphate phosphatase [Clostridia bacterium]